MYVIRNLASPAFSALNSNMQPCSSEVTFAPLMFSPSYLQLVSLRFSAWITTGSPCITTFFSQANFMLLSFSSAANTLSIAGLFSAANGYAPPIIASAVTAAMILLIFIVLLLYNIISPEAYKVLYIRFILKSILSTENLQFGNFLAIFTYILIVICFFRIKNCTSDFYACIRSSAFRYKIIP